MNDKALTIDLLEATKDTLEAAASIIKIYRLEKKLQSELGLASDSARSAISTLEAVADNCDKLRTIYKAMLKEAGASEEAGVLS